MLESLRNEFSNWLFKVLVLVLVLVLFLFKVLVPDS